MTPEQAAQVLTLMRGTWPRLAPDEVADRLWLEDLMGLEQAIAIDTFRSLRDTETNTPSWATFRAAYTNQAKSGKHRPPALPEAETIKPDPERLAELVERAREALTRPA
jgi:hypothetical protein